MLWMPTAAEMVKSQVAQVQSALAGLRGGKVADPPAALPVPQKIGDGDPLLGSRQFVTDIARIAEQMVMDDMPCDYWPTSGEPPNASRLHCREKAAVPDKCGDVTEHGEVRRRRASWAADIGERYAARVVQWCDTAHGREKQAALLLLRPPGEPPVAVIAWRGSKTATDYLRTDLSLHFVKLRTVAADGAVAPATEVAEAASAEAASAEAASAEAVSAVATEATEATEAARQTAAEPRAHPMLWERLRGSETPCVTRGLWEAYAGAGERAARRLGPDCAVRAALERLLSEEPACRICITGHSLGGALATLCAYDLATSSAVARARGVTLISFAAPRFFNGAFQRATAALQAEGTLRPLRVLVAGDLIPRLPPRMVGGTPGVRPRLALMPPPRNAVAFARAERSMAFRDGEGDDDDLWAAAPDVHAHTSHALFLGGETTPTRDKTVPLDAAWPLVSPCATEPSQDETQP